MLSDHIFPPWDVDRWRAVDDRVRGGSSTSHVELLDQSNSATASGCALKFWGHLDIDTLGGAGFTSQRYVFAPEPLHLPRHKFKGLILQIRNGGSKGIMEKDTVDTFTLVLKTSLSRRNHPPTLPPSPEPASLSYEANFTLRSDSIASEEELLGGDRTVELKINDFVPTYRGKEVKRSDPRYQPLHSEKIYEMSLMCRSGFGEQKGDFELVIDSISKWRKEGKIALFIAGCIDTWNGMLVWMESWFKPRGTIRLHDEVQGGF